jgi:aerobic carbon-monoxide dehydrogenase large subunit
MPEAGTAPLGAGEQRRSYIGARVRRREDERFLADGGCYVADIRRPHMADMAVVRSPLPHARINAIDLSAAQRAPGVLAAISAADLGGISAIPDYFDWARPVRNFPLMRDRVRYVGAPVAAIVATDRYLAEDAAELVDIDYEELPIVGTMDEALAPGAPRLYEDWPDNVMVAVPAAKLTDSRIFERAPRVVRGSYAIQRYGAMPMETRGAVAEYTDGRLTLWSSTQLPHILRTMLSTVLGVPESDLRVIAPDVGGAFGCKAELYPEEFLVAALAIRLGRPVRFVEDRAEHNIATGQARDMVIDLEAAVEDDGTILAIRGSIMQDLGSEEIYPPGFGMALTALGTLTGPYRIPEQAIRVACVVTSKTPAGAYRGFGMPEAVFAMERLMDKVARETGTDRLELRRRMLLRPAELPYTTASGAVLDSGSHAAAFERVLEMTRKSAERTRAEHADDKRIRIGSAVVNYVEGVTGSFFSATGNWTSQDSCAITFGPDGTVIVRTGVSTGGQGVWTMVATLTAEALGVPVERVRVMLGDTDLTPYGLGGWGSRSTNVFGGALLKAAQTVKNKGCVIAAHLLEAAVGDMVAENGVFHVAGSSHPQVTWADVARVAYVRTLELPPGVDPGLEATAFYDPPVDQVTRADGKINACLAYTNASQGVVLSVDVGTGEVRVLDYLVVHDCGTVINPMIVEGQIHGGVAQGIGGALYEHFVYSPEGQPLTTTFMDYLVPSAIEIPPISVEHFESPSPRTAFGAKGTGEAGLIGPAPAIAAAIEDALAEFGVPEITATPLPPAAVLRLIDTGLNTATGA